MVEQRWISDSGVVGATPSRWTLRRWSAAAVLVSLLLAAGAGTSDAAGLVADASAEPSVTGEVVATTVATVPVDVTRAKKPSKSSDMVLSGSKWSGSAWSGSKWS